MENKSCLRNSVSYYVVCGGIGYTFYDLDGDQSY